MADRTLRILCFVLMLCIIGLTSPAVAYFCWGQEDDPLNLLRDVDYVFIGEVSAIEDYGVDQDELGTPRSMVTFIPAEVWKGITSEDKEGVNIDVEALYRYDFRPGDRYLVYAYILYDDRITIVGCPRVENIEKQQKAIDQLGLPAFAFDDSGVTDVEGLMMEDQPIKTNAPQPQPPLSEKQPAAIDPLDSLLDTIPNNTMPEEQQQQTEPEQQEQETQQDIVEDSDEPEAKPEQAESPSPPEPAVEPQATAPEQTEPTTETEEEATRETETPAESDKGETTEPPSEQHSAPEENKQTSEPEAREEQETTEEPAKPIVHQEPAEPEPAPEKTETAPEPIVDENEPLDVIWEDGEIEVEEEPLDVIWDTVPEENDNAEENTPTAPELPTLAK